jgi:transcriptional regulator with XRE-family HTH domain
MKEKLIIRKELQRNKLTEEEAAQSLHISGDDLSQIISGGYEPNASLRGRIERLLNLPAGVLSSICGTCEEYGNGWCSSCNRS